MQILATKGHTVSTDNDTNLFTDADLSILGESWELYQEYFQKIRKEYAIYPDAVYNPGRTKVLNHFLSMERIFKTDIFHEKFELNAKNNLTRELVHLQEAF
jgi:predicted metal-dependent HD superfamily phosphohydrolase